MRKYNEQDYEQVKNLYINTSDTIDDISKKLDIPKGTLTNWISKYRWKKKEKRAITKIKIDNDFLKAKQLYEQTSLSIPKISEQCDLTVDQIRSRIDKFNWQRSDELKHQMFSDTVKNNQSKYTDEKWLEIKTKMKNTNILIWNNRSESDKQKIINNRLSTMNNKSQEELNEIHRKISKSVSDNWNNKSDEYKEQLSRKLSKIQRNLPEEKRLLKLKRDRATKHKNNSFKRSNSIDGKRFDSRYEVAVYEFCKRNDIPIETQIPISFTYKGEKHITYIDFKIDNMLFECKGGHLLHGIYDYALPIPIEKKLEVYKENHIILITDKRGRDVIPFRSNGLKYLDKNPYPLIGVDISLFLNPAFPFDTTKPKCFYKVKVDGKSSMLDAWSDEILRWKMIKNRINYAGGFINNKSILTAMNVTKNSKQPSWFDKNYAKYLIEKYITTDTIMDPFAGWGTRCDACKELGLKYYGWDLNQELVDYHISQGRFFSNDCKCGISYGDANKITNKSSNCSVFICPPYADVEIYFEGQDTEKTQCDWLKIIMKNFPKAKEYLMVCKTVEKDFKKYIVEEKVNKSHLGSNKEYVLLIKNTNIKY